MSGGSVLRSIESLIRDIDSFAISAESKEEECCHAGKQVQKCCGIDHASPLDAFKNGQREHTLYITTTRTGQENENESDFVAVVDVDPNSETYQQIVAQVNVGVGQEVHHSGWNACASCFGMDDVARRFLIVPAFISGDIHVVDCSDERSPKLFKTISGAEIKEKYGLSFPHTPHCLASGKVMLSFLGVDADNANSKGVDFLLINGDTFEVESRWVHPESKRPAFGYDYWYQPYHNIMLSSEWGAPSAFSKGFVPNDVANKQYGTTIHFWNWKEHTLLKSIEFTAAEVCMPLETRFCHDPRSVHAFVGCALTSNIIHAWLDADSGEWVADAQYIQTEAVPMKNWALPAMPALITDFLLSMDDKYLYFANWLHGDIRQYNIEDPFKPVLSGQLFVGGCIRGDSGFVVDNQKCAVEAPTVPMINGTRIEGGPQMIQLSLDGTRMYVTNSLFSAYDQQFYPDLMRKGGQLLLVDVDHENGGMKLNTQFMVDFGKCKGGPARPHEVRYPGGDCTSDIFLAQD